MELYKEDRRGRRAPMCFDNTACFDMEVSNYEFVFSSYMHNGKLWDLELQDATGSYGSICMSEAGTISD